MKYYKLIRDKIARNLIEKGKKVIFHIAPNEEYEAKLLEKLQEEVKEFQEAKNIEELADIQEVLEAIQEFYRFDKREIKDVKDKKKTERGGFQEKVILEEVVD